MQGTPDMVLRRKGICKGKLGTFYATLYCEQLFFYNSGGIIPLCSIWTLKLNSVNLLLSMA